MSEPDNPDPEAEAPLHIVTVRDRPVGFRPSRYGGEFHAVERGYFPVSTTGYRSLARAFDMPLEQQHAALTPDFLEAHASAEDRERRLLIKRVSRPPVPGRETLSDFISATMDAEKALADGFFAPDANRADLWTSAYRLLLLIENDKRLQPQPNGDAWTAESCEGSMQRNRVLRVILEGLAKGDFFPTQTEADTSAIDLL